DVEHPGARQYSRCRRQPDRDRDDRPPRSVRRLTRDADRRGDARAHADGPLLAASRAERGREGGAARRNARYVTPGRLEDRETRTKITVRRPQKLLNSAAGVIRSRPSRLVAPASAGPGRTVSVPVR